MADGNAAASQGAANPRWTREILLENARALVPVMRERALDCEKNRKVSQESIDDLHKSGLLRVIQPAWVGGAEADFTTYMDVCAEIAKGCASTSWVLTNLASHHFMLAYWPEQAQREMWDEDPDILIASGLSFQFGEARKVDGGYKVSGRWPFSSGIDNSTWNMVGTFMAPDDDPDGEPVARMFLIPQSDYKQLDTWHATGLAGTGSHDVVVEDAFVPSYRTVSIPEIVDQTAPGLALNPGTLFRLPFFAMFPYVVGCVTLGIAEGALEGYVGAMKSRVGTYTGKRLADLDAIQMRVGEAAAAVRAASLLIRTTSDDVTAKTEADYDFPIEERAHIRLNAAYACQQCVRAVDVLFAAAGGGALQEKNPLQRAFRDVHATVAHIHLNWDALSRSYGRAALGLPLEGNL